LQIDCEIEVKSTNLREQEPSELSFKKPELQKEKTVEGDKGKKNVGIVKSRKRKTVGVGTLQNSTQEDTDEILGNLYHGLFTSTTNTLKDPKQLKEGKDLEDRLQKYIKAHRGDNIAVQEKLLSNVEEGIRKITSKQEQESDVEETQVTKGYLCN
jgi:hypothetical protein